jgi:hypothetical protein
MNKKPIYYPKKLNIDFFRNAKILNTDKPLYRDYKGAYEDYVIRYEQWGRDEKITKILEK